MHLKLTVILIALSICWSFPSCKSQAEKDAETKAKIEALIPGITVNVKNGIATLSGELTSEEESQKAIANISKISGVQFVVNNTSIPAATSIDSNQLLTDGTAALLAAFPGVMASVRNNVITLSGEITKENWVQLQPMLTDLHPKKVIPDLTVK